MANDLLNKYLNETGEFPRKVSVFLWATETMKHLGVMESEILALLELRWNMTVSTGQPCYL